VLKHRGCGVSYQIEGQGTGAREGGISRPGGVVLGLQMGGVPNGTVGKNEGAIEGAITNNKELRRWTDGCPNGRTGLSEWTNVQSCPSAPLFAMTYGMDGFQKKEGLSIVQLDVAHRITPGWTVLKPLRNGISVRPSSAFARQAVHVPLGFWGEGGNKEKKLLSL